jgi:hypothetical protein
MAGDGFRASAAAGLAGLTSSTISSLLSSEALAATGAAAGAAASCGLSLAGILISISPRAPWARNRAASANRPRRQRQRDGAHQAAAGALLFRQQRIVAAAARSARAARFRARRSRRAWSGRARRRAASSSLAVKRPLSWRRGLACFYRRTRTSPCVISVLSVKRGFSGRHHAGDGVERAKDHNSIILPARLIAFANAAAGSAKVVPKIRRLGAGRASRLQLGGQFGGARPSAATAAPPRTSGRHARAMAAMTPSMSLSCMMPNTA